MFNRFKMKQKKPVGKKEYGQLPHRQGFSAPQSCQGGHASLPCSTVLTVSASLFFSFKAEEIAVSVYTFSHETFLTPGVLCVAVAPVLCAGKCISLLYHLLKFLYVNKVPPDTLCSLGCFACPFVFPPKSAVWRQNIHTCTHSGYD